MVNPRAEGAPILLRDRILEQDRLFAQWDRARNEDRLPHATLLLGPRGCGKGRVALALAQDLLCAGPEVPCGQCAPCRQVAHLTHPDLQVVLPVLREDLNDLEELANRVRVYAGNPRGVWELPGNASIGIDQVRRLKEEVAMAGVQGDRRVLCILGADRMTEQAVQAALKLVEEPPPHVFLFLTAEDPAQLLPTLVSRCQRVRLTPLCRETVARVLTAELGVAEQEASLLSALSGGSLGSALAMQKGDILGFRDRVLPLFEMKEGGAGGRLAPAEVERRVALLTALGEGEAIRRAGHLLLIWYHDLLNARSGLPDRVLANADLANEARRQGAALSVPELGRRVRIVEEMCRAVEQNVNPALALHIALSRIGSPSWDDGL